MFSIGLLAIFTLVGAGVDYARLAAAKVALQSATDSAALGVAGAGGAGGTNAGQQMAAQIVAANYTAYPVTVVESEPVDATGSTSFVIEARIDVPLNFGGFLGFKSWPISARATAVAAGGPTTYEVALALDNTGSMAASMSDLRTAATNFVNKVMTSPKVKVSVVPYVAAVNPGLDSPSVIDMPTDYPLGIWNGDMLRWQWLTMGAGCTPAWGPGGNPIPPSGSSSSGDVGGSAIDLIEILNPFRRIARAVFGVSEARADMTARTTPPLNLSKQTSPSTGKTYMIPDGFAPIWVNPASPQDTAGCDWLANSVVAVHELFGRIKTAGGAVAKWKGCVEARPSKVEIQFVKDSWGWSAPTVDDLDVKETPPDPSDPNTLFVPYFWPDEPDIDPATGGARAPGVYSSAVGGFHNNYLSDGTLPGGWNWTSPWPTDSLLRPLFKYDGTTAAVVKETWPNTVGPNASCPDAVLRLTNNLATVRAKIADSGYWYNGGTVISEGIMWAWRTLSPLAPYADGQAYGTAGNKKVIVLMTDGVNGLATNGGDASEGKSDYSAYGYLGATRMRYANNVTNFDDLATFLDGKTRAACANAKAAGITIHTILFNHGLDATQTARATKLLTDCATTPPNFHLATDLATLNAAFTSVATGVGNVRLVK